MILSRSRSFSRQANQNLSHLVCSSNASSAFSQIKHVYYSPQKFFSYKSSTNLHECANASFEGDNPLGKSLQNHVGYLDFLDKTGAILPWCGGNQLCKNQNEIVDSRYGCNFSQRARHYSNKSNNLPLDLIRRKGSALFHNQATNYFQGTFEDEIGDSMVHQMLDISEFAYLFAELRGVVRDNDIEESSPENNKGVKFNSPELIITQRGAQPKDQNRLLKHPITVPAIKEFIELNRCFLSEKANGDIYFDDKTKSDLPTASKDLPKLRLEVELEKYMSIIDSELLDFDDRITTNGGLVYSIVKNKTNKRFTVGFRGTAGLKDIFNDGKFAFKKTPEIFKETEYKPRIHRGFASYLFDNRKEVHEDGSAVMRTRFDRIVASLKDSFEELDEDDRKNYDVCVTGHSLGGALANLLAYGIAETERDCSFFDKVLAMTFASPVVGGQSYNEAFQALEKEGRLRHIRISNENDLIPTQPYPFYTQNGVNLHLRKDKKMEYAYRNTKIVFSQLSFSNPLTHHGLEEYENRLFSIPDNKSILEKSIAELYSEVREFTN